MTKLTNTLSRLFTAGAALSVVVTLAAPASAEEQTYLEQLKLDTASLESRAASAALVPNLAFQSDAASLLSHLAVVEGSLRFPEMSGIASTANAPFSTYMLLSQALTTRDTMLLRACRIAEDAAPAAGVNRESISARLNAIQNALRLSADIVWPSDVSRENIELANLDTATIFDSLGSFMERNPSWPMSTYLYKYLVNIMWQGAVEAVATVLMVGEDDVVPACEAHFAD